MSGFAFSHQFSKRWLATPAPVKHAIIQELDDIVTLLYPDTDLDGYQFSVPNLHDKVEELLAIERDHQEKLQAQLRERELEEQRLEQERLEKHRLEQERLENKRLETERLEKERLEQQRLEAERLKQERHEAEHLEQQRLEQAQLTQENEQERQAQDDAAIALLEQERAIAKQAHLAKQANPAKLATQLSTGSIEGANHQLDEQAQSKDTATSDVTIERHRSEMVYAIDHTDTADNTDKIAEPLADDPTAALMTHETRVTDPLVDIANPSIATTPAIEQIKQDIVKQLQGYIDNYLLESMTLMNEDLNQWLKTEVEKQLTVRLSQSH
ncbi:hypothetical protein I6I86_00600 [Moraxella osloensis]|nr:hypothetical protein [Moraxella osloensis]MBL7666456.1 hypothetical protein [Moraxella osloensis]